jgi:hypothetical protein
MLFDFTILDGSEVRGETVLLTVAVERQRLAPILAALAAVKIEPERVTLSGFAAAAWIGRNLEPDQTALCLDIGETSGALFVVAGAQVRLIRTFPLPADPAARGRAVRSHIRLTMGALNELSAAPKPPAAIFLTGSGIAGMNLEVLADALPVELKPADLTRLLGVPHDDDAGAWDPLRMPGGSSGGAAVAVASGMLPAAHASDGGGSIHIPSSCNGVFGLKPSRGRNPIGPDVGEGWNGLSVQHVITRSVRDSAAFLDVTHGPEPGDPYAAPAFEGSFLKGLEERSPRLRIAFQQVDHFGQPMNPVTAAAVREAAQLLQELGHQVEEARPIFDAEAL